MQTKKFFAPTLAAIAAAAAMTASVATSTAVSVASVVAPAVMVAMTPIEAQAGRRDPDIPRVLTEDDSWVAPNGLVLSECAEDGLVLSECDEP